MVTRPGITSQDIAETYGRSLDTVTKDWMQDQDWPEPIGTRGHFKEFDPKQVAAWVATHRQRDTALAIHTGDPERLLTLREIAEESGLSYNTIRADVSRGRLLPKDGDAQEDGVKLWKRGTIAPQIAGRRPRRAPGK